MNYRIPAIICFMMATNLGCFAEQPADTVKVIEKASNIVVVNKGGKTVLNADFPGRTETETLHYQYEVDVACSDSARIKDEFPDNWGMDLPFLKTKDLNVKDNRVRRYVAVFRRAYWGWRFNYSGKGNVRNGWEVGVPDFLAVTWQRRAAEFEIGVGFSGSRYYASDGFGYEKQGDRLLLAPTPASMKAKESYLDIFTFQVPVLYNQKIGKDFSFSLGAIANFNTYAMAKTKLMSFEEKYRQTTYKGLQQNFFTVDTYASVNLCGFGVYARWSPMSVFKKQFGPELKGFSIGVEISFDDLFTL